MPKETTREKECVAIRFAIFFDGTLNNAINLQAALSGTTGAVLPSAGSPALGGGSYTDDFTNVYRLYSTFNGYQSKVPGHRNYRSYYIGGVGTENGQADDALDVAFATGATGIKAKAIQALQKCTRDMVGRYRPDQPLCVYFDVFGFSRGAATARHFIHRVVPQGEDVIRKSLRKHKLDVRSVEVNFAGLFDTVASYGKNQRNDTRELKLDAVKHVRGLCYHLCAQDEFRENFSLTNIDSAVAAGKGRELFLPGAHADVGGGYSDKIKETTITIDDARIGTQTTARDMNFLTSGGWFAANQVATRTALSLGGSSSQYNLASRAYVYNNYTYVPLRMMANKAKAYGLKFDAKAMAANYPIQYTDVKLVQRLVTAYAKRVDADAGDNAVSWGYSGLPSETLPSNFRRFFCHYSANEDSIGNKTRWRSHPRAMRKRNIYGG